MSSQILLNALHAGTVYGLVAISFGLIHSTARVFHVAHASVYATVGYIAFTFAGILHVPLPFTVILAIVAAIALGAGTELLVYGPLRRRGSHSSVLLLCSLGIFVALQNIISLIFGDATKSLHEYVPRGVITIAEGRLTYLQAAEILVSFLLFVSVWKWLQGSTTGRTLRAVSNDPELSQMVGVDIGVVYVVVFCIGSALVSVAGLFAGFDTDLTPLMGFRVLLMAVVASVVGGKGSVPGTLAAAFTLAALQQLSAQWLPIHWQDTIVFGILLLVMFVKPNGLLGRPLREHAG